MLETVMRVAQVIGIKLDKLNEYKYHHAHPWAEINAIIKECNIENYSIYYNDGLLFSYFDYVGDNYEKDMAKMAANPKTQEWWDLVKPFQDPLSTRKEGEWWSEMEEVFHLD